MATTPANAALEKVETLLALPVPLTPDAVKNALVSSALAELFALNQIAELRLQLGRVERQLAECQRQATTSRN
jgi:hypothetical protein